MSSKKPTRRQRLRNQQALPAGSIAALMVAAMVTLLGAARGIQPPVILLRAAVSAVLIGCLVSLGFGIVRLADAEHKQRQQGRR